MEYIEYVVTPTGCWEWAGRRHTAGYGLYPDKRYAHRVAFEQAYGHIPADHSVCHRCDNPPCINPNHLFIGTHKQNMHDMQAKGRKRGPQGETHPHARLTAEQAKEIYARPLESSRKLAKEYGVSHTTINGIRGGKAWRSVTSPKGTPDQCKADFVNGR